MGLFFPKALQPGIPISTVGFAKALQGMAYALEYMAVDGGFITWSNLGVPTIHINAASSRYDPPDTGSTDNAPKAWDIDIDGADVTCSDCVYMRGPVTHAITAPAAITLSGNTVFVAARIKLSDNTATLIQAATLAGATDASWPADGTYLKRLLYKIERADADSPYRVTMDYRNEPEPDTVPVAPSSPTVLHSGGSGESTGTADTTTWTAGNADGKGITIWNTMRLKDDTSDGKIYAFMRSLTFDMNGKLQAVSAETKVEISDSVTHSSQHPTT
jgi:hypothetical protein